MPNRFYMMTPAFDKAEPIDIICVTSEHNLNALLNFRRTHPWVSLVSIDQATAYKALSEYGHAGIGCYIGDDDCGRSTLRLRRSLASLKLHTLHMECKSLDLHPPVCIVFHAPTIREVAREVLTLTFARAK